jgi:hypothetical protein
VGTVLTDGVIVLRCLRREDAAAHTEIGPDPDGLVRYERRLTNRT